MSGSGSSGSGVSVGPFTSSYDVDAVVTLGNEWEQFGDTLRTQFGVMSQAIEQLNSSWTGAGGISVYNTFQMLSKTALSPLPDVCYQIGGAINQYGEAVQDAELKDLKKETAAQLAQGLGALFGLVIGPAVGFAFGAFSEGLVAGLEWVADLVGAGGFDVTVLAEVLGGGIVGGVVSLGTDLVSEAVADKIYGVPFTVSETALLQDVGEGIFFGGVDPIGEALEKPRPTPTPAHTPDPVPTPKSPDPVPTPKVPDPKVPGVVPPGEIPPPKVGGLTDHPGLKSGGLPGSEPPGALGPRGGPQHADVTVAPPPPHNPAAPHDPAPHGQAPANVQAPGHGQSHEAAPAGTPHGPGGSTNPFRAGNRPTDTNPFRAGNRTADETAAAAGLLPAARKLTAPRPPEDDRPTPPVTGAGKGDENLSAPPPRDVSPAAAQPPKDAPSPARQSPRDGQPTDGQPPGDEARPAPPTHNDPPTRNETSHVEPKAEQDDAAPPSAPASAAPHGGDHPASSPGRSGQYPAPQRRDADEEAVAGATHAQTAPQRAGGPSHPQSTPDPAHASPSRAEVGPDTASHQAGDGQLDLGGGRVVELPPGTKAGYGDGRLWHVTLPDDTVYHRTLDGGWSAPRDKGGDMVAIKTSDPITVKLKDGGEVTFSAKSDLITDRHVNVHGDESLAGPRPATHLTSGGDRPGDLGEVDGRGTDLIAIRGTGHDGEVHTVVHGKDGWTEVRVDETHYQATLAAAEKRTDVAQAFLRLHERRDSLTGLGHDDLKSLLNRPDSSDDDRFAAIYEILRRGRGDTQGLSAIRGKSARWVQVAAAKELDRGNNVNMDAGEGKTLMFQLAAVTKALKVRADGEGVMFVTSRDYLADEAHKAFSLFEGYGVKVLRIKQEVETPLPVKDEATIYVTTLREDAFNKLEYPGHQPNVHQLVDEQDENMFYVDQAFIKNVGPDTPAPPEVRGQLGWDDQFVKDKLNSLDYEHDGGTFHLNDSGLAKLKQELNTGGEPPADRVAGVEQSVYAHHGLREGTHYVVNPHEDRINLIEQVTNKVSVDDGQGVGATRFRGGLHQRLEVKHGTMVREDSPEGTDKELSQRDYFNQPSIKSVTGASGTNMGKQGHYDALRSTDGSKGEVYKAPRYYAQRSKEIDSLLAGDRADKFDKIADIVIDRSGRGDATLVLPADNRDVGGIAAALESKGFTHFTRADADWYVTKNWEFKQAVEAGNRAEAKTADEALGDVIDKVGKPGQVTLSSMINRGADPAVDEAVSKLGGLGVITDHSKLSSDIDIQAINRGGRNGDKSTYQFVDSVDDEIFTGSHNPSVPIAIYQYKRVLSVDHPRDIGVSPGDDTPHDGLVRHRGDPSDDGMTLNGSDASHGGSASISTATSNRGVSSLRGEDSFDPAGVGGDADHQLRQAGQRLLHLVPTLQAEAFHQRVTDGVFRLQNETFAQLGASTGRATAPATPVSHPTPAHRGVADGVDNLLGQISRQLGRSVPAEPVAVQRELAQLQQAVTHWARETGITHGHDPAGGANRLQAQQRQRMADKALTVAVAARPGDTPALAILKSAAAKVRGDAQAARAGAAGPGGSAAHLGTDPARAVPETARTDQNGRPAAPRVTVGDHSFMVRDARGNGDDASFRFGQPTSVGVGPGAGGGFFTAMYESAKSQGFASALGAKGITSARELRQAALDGFAAEPAAPGQPRDGPLHRFDSETLDYWMEEGARRATELAHIARDEGFAEAIATVIHEARFDGTRLGALLPLITAQVLDLPLTMVVSSTAGTSATALGQQGDRQIFVGYDSAQRSWRTLVPAETVATAAATDDHPNADPLAGPHDGAHFGDLPSGAGREAKSRRSERDDSQRTVPETVSGQTPEAVLTLREPSVPDARHESLGGLLDELNGKLHGGHPEDLHEAFALVDRMTELVAARFAQLVGPPLEGATQKLVAAPEDGLAASFIANRVANNLQRTVVLAVAGQVDVNICPD